MIRDLDLDRYQYFKEFDNNQYKKFIESKENQNKFKFRLPVGDLFLLKSLPVLIKNLPEKKKLMSKPPKYALKRKFESDENEPPNTENNEMPKKKKKLLEGDVEAFKNKFQAFIEKIAPGSDGTIEEGIDGENPKFCLICRLCDKLVRISFKITKNLQPSFVKTNWISHSCNKTPSVEEFQVVNQIKEVNEDSGFVDDHI